MKEILQSTSKEQQDEEKDFEAEEKKTSRIFNLHQNVIVQETEESMSPSKSAEDK